MPKTIVKSPKQLLREHFAAKRGSEPVRGQRQGDWSKFHVGDQVFDKADERHLGCIRAIYNSAVAKIAWDDTGWVSEVRLANLRHAPKEALPDVQTVLRNRIKKGKGK